MIVLRETDPISKPKKKSGSDNPEGKDLAVIKKRLDRVKKQFFWSRIL
jgi:hypothetical protein